ncbi:glutamate--tRNA ligase, cytoplasmic [Tanacetum coccineum]|uniref:Glutamate--tRNA ligase, cytoplasmic n=1 Tax=Tanacetum coccineum TaxID=301880 RepID=A0ABQ5FVZ6_9ASTR
METTTQQKNIVWNINKKIVDPVCPRHTAIVEEGRVLLTLTDGPETPFVRMIPKHKKYVGAGEKATTFTKKIWIEQAAAKDIEQAVAKAIAEKMPPNVEVTLMDWGNAIVEEIKKDSDGNVTEIIGKLHLEGSVKDTELKLTWLPEINELAPLTLVEFDYLITKKKLDKNEDFVGALNPDTKKKSAAVGDANMRNLNHGDILQLERKGYFRCDVPFIRPSKPIVLYAIPDGRQTAPPKEKLEDQRGVTTLQVQNTKRKRGAPNRTKAGRKRKKGRGAFNRLRGKGKSVFAHSKSRYQSSRSERTESVPRKRHHEGMYSRKTEMLYESEDSGGGHWKSRAKKAKSSIEKDYLS